MRECALPHRRVGFFAAAAAKNPETEAPLFNVIRGITLKILVGGQKNIMKISEILKKTSIVLSALLLTGAVAGPVSASAENLPEFYDSASFVGQPAVCAEVTDAQSLAALSGEELPSSVILTVDESLAVAGSDGASLGTFPEVYESAVEGKMLLIVRPSSSEALSAFAAYEEENDIAEFALLSSDAMLLDAAATECPEAYLFLETANLYTLSECAGALQRANLVGAQTILVPGETCEAEFVRYLQARFKSVWVRTDGSAVSVADAIGYGVYGIVSPTAAPVYEVYEKIAGAAEAYTGAGTLSVLARSPFIAAHRGDTIQYSENTVNAVVAAGQNGATHAEIDIRLTSDGEIVLLHDDSIQYALRNEDGSAASGNVSRMTLAQLKSYSMSDGVSRIATLDEIFTAMQTEEGLDDLILIIEVKSGEPELITLFAQKLTEYNMAERVVVISFDENQIRRVREALPSTSCSLLIYTSDGSTAVSEAHALGAGIDMQFNGNPNLRSLYGDGSSAANSYNAAFRAFADRGYALWLWTYDMETMNEGLRNGVTGITTDDPRYTQDTAKALAVRDVYEVESLPEEYADFTIEAETYAGETVEIPAAVVWLEKGEREGTAVLVGRTNYAVGLVSESVTFRVAESESSAGEGGSGCGSAVAGCCAGVGALAAAAWAIKRGRR